MKSTFSVIYYLKRQVVKKDGTVPVMGRITVDGSQTQFSCKLTVDPKLWDTKGGRVTGRSSAALETNRMLDKMRVRINKHYQEIMERDNFVTAEKVKNAFIIFPGLYYIKHYRCIFHVIHLIPYTLSYDPKLCNSFLLLFLFATHIRCFLKRQLFFVALFFPYKIGSFLSGAKFPLVYLNFTAVPYAITSAAPCITAEDA